MQIHQIVCKVGDMSTGQNIRRFREGRGMTQPEFGRIAGVGASAVSNWENDQNLPLMGAIENLAQYFGVPKSAITDGLPVAAETRTPYASATTAPVYGRIAAGKPIDSLPVNDSYWVPPDVLAAHPRAFYLRVEGESMNRRYPNGSLALVDPDAEVTSGDVAAVNVNGYDATIKRVLLGSTSITLAPDSTDESFTDMIFDHTKPDTDTVTLIGRVVWGVVPYEK